MTSNQVRLYEAMERERSNRANEAQTVVRDAEVARHNLQQESFNADTLSETARSNRAREAETYRYNSGMLDLRDRELSETTRSNLAREAETNRYNTAQIFAQARQQAEAVRHNTYTEQHDAAVLAEQNRHNVVNEALTNQQRLTNREVAMAQLASNRYLRGLELQETARMNDIMAIYYDTLNAYNENRANTNTSSEIRNWMNAASNWYDTIRASLNPFRAITGYESFTGG